MFDDITPFFDLDKILWQYYEKLLGLWFITYKVEFTFMRRLFLQINDIRRDMEKLAEILQALKSRELYFLGYDSIVIRMTLWPDDNIIILK